MHFRKTFGRISCQAAEQAQSHGTQAKTRHKKSRPRSSPSRLHRGRISSPLRAKLVKYYRIRRDGTISDIFRRPRRPHQSSSASRAGGMSVSVPKQPTGPAKSWLMKERSLVFYIKQDKGRGGKKKRRAGKNERFRSVVIIFSLRDLMT